VTTLLGAHAEVDDHLEALRIRGHDVVVVTAGVDKATTLDAFARALDLPSWFGHNWDALADALRDYDGPEGRSARLGRPVELVVDHARTLRDTDSHTWSTLLDVLDEVEHERDDLTVTVVAR
jgi:RNAse (barnase) inhibitor barstar